MLIVFVGYLLILVAVLVTERLRTAPNGPDLFTCFLGLFAVQTLLPGAFITGVIALRGRDIEIRRSFFDKVFQDLDFETAGTILLMTVMFLAFLYLVQIALCGTRSAGEARAPSVILHVAIRPWIAIVAVGLLSCGWLVSSLGGGVEAYAKLIQFRAGDPSVQRSFLTANAFSLTQTFALISIVGVTVFLVNRNWFFFAVAMICAVTFSLMTASRRALFVQLILIYFVFILEYRRLFLGRWLVPIIAVALPIVMYGKELLGAIAFNTRVDFSDFGLGSIARALMDFGITTVESWATLMYLHVPFRLGIDHLLSVARRVPEGALGLSIDFPERIVRISTETFVGRNEADLPPGFFGQMWLDWGYVGPAIWGIAFGLQMGLLQKLYSVVGKSVGAKAIFALVVFVISLPINTGSLDFSFSIDMFVLFGFILLILRLRRQAVSGPVPCRPARQPVSRP